MTAPPILTDRLALARQRNRARSLPGHAAEQFLHRLALTDVQERLIEVNRTFTAPAVVSGFPEIWQEIGTTARMVTDSEVLDLEPATLLAALHQVRQCFS